MGMGPRRTFLRVLLAAAALCAGQPLRPAPCGAEDPGPSTGDDAAPTTVLFFVSYQDRFKLPVSPTEVRLTGCDIFVASANSRGERIVPYADVWPLLRDWRVRSSSSFSQGFLDALTSRFGSRQVLIADLILYADRLLLSVRRTETSSGRLIWLQTVEGERRTFQKLSEKWREDLARACEELDWRDPGYVPKSDATALVVLPVEPVGSSAAQANWATRSLLRSLLASRDWLLPDPALALWALQDAGCEVSLIDRKARETLGPQFQPAAILVPKLVTFALAPARRNLPVAYEDDDEVAWPSSAEGADDPAYLTLLAIDGQTGRIFLGAGEYVPVDPGAGLFGVPIDRPQSRRYDEAVGALLRILPSKRRGDRHDR